VKSLQQEFTDMADLEFRARSVVDRMALALQASLLVRHAPAMVSDAFCAGRLAAVGQHNYGTLPKGVDAAGIIRRARGG
jgi:putative acyl-CoA dehydrogenase